MRIQGCSTLLADEQGRVLDKLAGLESVIDTGLVLQALEATGRVNQRRCKFSHDVMMWVVLAMGLFTHLSIRQVFKQSRRMRKYEEPPGRSSLCEARRRLGVEPVVWLHAHVVKLLATPDTPGAFYKGLRWMGLDGSIFDVPDSTANAAAYHRSAGSRGKAAFPQVRKVSLVELGTHVEVAMAIGGWQHSEQELAPQLWDHIPPDALLAEDRGFFSYEDWKKLNDRGTKMLVRVKSNMLLKPLQPLSDGSYLAKIYKCSWNRERDRHGIVVRVLEYTLDDPQRTGHQERHRLMTNLLDETLYPMLELIMGYHERWEEELTYKEGKVYQDPPRVEKPTHLRSETPEGVLQEMYALSLGHFVIRSLMFEAAKVENVDPDRLSFTGCFRTLQSRLVECDNRTSLSIEEWCEALLWEMSRERLPPRANRVNPRVVKRKMSKWNKKRPEHRNRPPLKKTFIETVVMTN